MTNPVEYNPATFDFKSFSSIVSNNLSRLMKNRNIFRSTVTGDELWSIYLSSFPEGTNPIFRERTYHDGQYDKNFIRRVGNVVSIDDNGYISSIWEGDNIPWPYNIVAEKMNKALINSKINTLFRIKEHLVGNKSNTELTNNGPLTWNHFNSKIISPHQSYQAGTDIGEFDSAVQVFKRGLETISSHAIDTVLDLIKSKSIYRGEEFESVVRSFKKAHTQYHKINDPIRKSTFVWSQQPNTIRNSSIGTLLVDLSEDVDVETAVRKFESKVAPTNYKRTKSLITEKMVKDSFKTIDDMNLRSSLERRHATVSDLSVNDVIWVDRQVESKMKDSLMDSMMSTVITKKPQSKSLISITRDEFFNSVVPKAKTIEVEFLGSLQNLLMNITAPVHSDSESLFHWGNSFAWAYNGDVADSSLAYRVSQKGGNIDVPLRASLEWFNYDDYDLRARCPDGLISFSNKKGILDVDENVSASTRTPVENLSWKNPKNGDYTISVNNFTNREQKDFGFRLELSLKGSETITLEYNKFIKNKETVNIVSFTMKDGAMTDLKILNKNIRSNSISEDIWGITTNKFVKVQTIVESPNYWENSGSNKGNRHDFFILEGCKNPDNCRGFYNEYLTADLNKHRKVFEVLGTKTMVQYSEEQLAGIGISSTSKQKVVFKVTTDDSVKTYNVQF